MTLECKLSFVGSEDCMDDIKMILCGSIEDSSSNSGEKVGVVSVVFISYDDVQIKKKLEELQKENPNNFYMEYSMPLGTDLTQLEHYPSIEISKEDLQD